MTKITRMIMLLMLAVAAGSAIEVNAQSSAGGGRLTGAWDASVTIYVCATGAPIRQFASVGTFHQGGTFTGITAGTPPALRSPEQGVWRHRRDGTYVFRFKAFLFDPAGNPTGYQVVTHTIELGGDNLHYVSDGGVQIFNMAGTQVGSGCSSAVGTRIAL